MMSIALDPFVNGYHPANSDHADPATVAQSHFARSHTTIDTPASDPIAAAGLKFIYTFSVLAVSGALLALAGWMCFDLLASLQSQLESLSTMQLLHALAGA
jgi:hypothetical protein